MSKHTRNSSHKSVSKRNAPHVPAAAPAKFDKKRQPCKACSGRCCKADAKGQPEDHSDPADTTVNQSSIAHTPPQPAKAPACSRANDPIRSAIVKRVKETAAAIKPDTLEAATRFLSKLALTPDDIAGIPRAAPGEYIRDTLLSAKEFAVVLISWNSVDSSIHAHKDSECFLTIIEGEVIERRFRDLGNWKAKLVRERRLCPGEIIESSRSTIHQIVVPAGDGPVTSLHIYSPELNAKTMPVYTEVGCD